MANIREAILILPKRDNSGQSLAKIHKLLQAELIAVFGGYSTHNSAGAWRDESTGIVYSDDSVVYTVAADWSQAMPLYPLITRAEKLEAIAREFANLGRQVAIYVRHGDGGVVFVSPTESSAQNVPMTWSKRLFG